MLKQAKEKAAYVFDGEQRRVQRSSWVLGDI